MELKLYYFTTRSTTLIPHHHHRHRHHCHNHRTPTCTLSTTTPSTTLTKLHLETLEWTPLCTNLTPFTSTTMAQSTTQSGSIPLGQTLQESQKLLAQTTAALGLTKALDFSGVADVSEVVGLCADGNVLSIGELCGVGRTLRAAKRLFDQVVEVSDGRLKKKHGILTGGRRL